MENGKVGKYMGTWESKISFFFMCSLLMDSYNISKAEPFWTTRSWSGRNRTILEFPYTLNSHRE